MTGIYPADTFFNIDINTGRIYVKNSLKTDSLKLGTYTVRVVAYDSYYPHRRTTEDIIVTVVRNPNKPAFSTCCYSKRISENFAVGSSVIQVSADDQDGVSFSCFEISFIRVVWTFYSFENNVTNNHKITKYLKENCRLDFEEQFPFKYFLIIPSVSEISQKNWFLAVQAIIIALITFD